MFVIYIKHIQWNTCFSSTNQHYLNTLQATVGTQKRKCFIIILHIKNKVYDFDIAYLWFCRHICLCSYKSHTNVFTFWLLYNRETNLRLQFEKKSLQVQRKKMTYKCLKVNCTIFQVWWNVQWNKSTTRPTL